jgi:hypothetical protein
MFATLDPGRRWAIVIGVLLVSFGILALVGQAMSVDLVGVGWPLFVIVPGVLLFSAALAIGGTAGVGLAIPGTIVTVTGIVLLLQAVTGLWATWAYAWALVAPGGVGLGMVLYGFSTAQPGIARAGIPPLLAGLALFLGFGLFFEGALGLSGARVSGMETMLAAGLVILGGLVIAASLMGRRGPTV